MKNKNFLFPLALFSFCLALVFFGRTAEAVSGAGGLWGQYSKKYTNSEFVEIKVENVDFENFDQVLNDTIGQKSNAEVIWRGGVYAEEAGKYGIRLYNYGGYIQRLYVGGSSLGSSNGGSISKTVSLKKGWNELVLFYKVSSSKPDSALRLFWTPPGKAEEIIPKDNLGYKFWSDKVLTIPSGEDKKRLDYIAAGAGTRGKTEVSIEVDMPENVLDDEVWFIFYKASGSSNQIEIKNETVGSGYKNVSGAENLNFMGFSADYPEVYGRIPASLIDDDGSGKMKLKFRKTDGWGDGISLIVPFEDPDTSKPEGKISIRLVAATAYRGASPVMTFPIEDTGEDKTMNPLFIAPNGETKTNASDEPRPNYLVMRSGSGSAPREADTLIKMTGTKMIVPQMSPMSKSNSETWYPVYGRDGQQLDVVSSRASNPDGKIDPIIVPAGHTWVAFQYYGSNYVADGKDGNGESASITGGGLFSEKAIDEFKLEVNVSGAGKVVSDDGIIDCPSVKCEHKYVFGTDVKLTAIPDAGNNFLPGWSGDECSGTDKDCNVFIDSEKNINAGFSPVATLGGICGGANGGSFCNEPFAKCHLGDPIGLAFDSASSSWSWKCRYNGIDSPLCSATRNCAIREITP